MESIAIKIASAQYQIDFLESIEQWKNKTCTWVESAVANEAKYLLFPEYASMELTSLLSEVQRGDIKSQSLAMKEFLPIFLETFKTLAIQHHIYIVAPSYPVLHENAVTTNRVFIFSPAGQMDFQDKLYMTRFEDEDWFVQSGTPEIKIFSTPDLKFAVSTCFDVEFSFPALAAAHAGAEILFVPSCTETIKGANRVHIGARARGLENQMYVVVSQLVGEAAWSPAVDINVGFAGFYCTPDVGFADDGVLKRGELNKVGWEYCNIRTSHLKKVRSQGAVFNYKRHEAIIKTHPIYVKALQVAF